ncbi:hypothetical protein BHE74_00008374 [Ensete ventricosum]|nr:hypothetical protein BHE74_00008374 [Ensete ventricosum]
MQRCGRMRPPAKPFVFRIFDSPYDISFFCLSFGSLSMAEGALRTVSGVRSCPSTTSDVATPAISFQVCKLYVASVVVQLTKFDYRLANKLETDLQKLRCRSISISFADMFTRRYFGHKRTLRPNAKKLYSLFLNRANMTWEQFSLKVHSYQRGFLGEPKEVRPGRGEFHENPSACICETTKAMRGKHSGSLSPTNADDQHPNSNRGHSVSEPTYNRTDEEPDWSDMDYGEYTPLSKSLSNSTDMDYDPFIRSEDSELEDFLSD